MTTAATTSAATSTGNVFTNLNQARTASNTAQQLQTQFLTLLTKQLQNQDPTNPADSSQMTSQLAQISMVSGIQDLNTSINGMATTFNAAQSFQAAGLIGHQVLATGNAMIYDGKNAVEAQVNVPDKVSAVSVQVVDGNGNIVDTLPIGKGQSGLVNLSWDGKDSNGNALPAGTYTLVAQAKGTDGSAQNLSTSTFVTVQSVSIDGSGITLQTSGGESIAMTDVSQID